MRKGVKKIGRETREQQGKTHLGIKKSYSNFRKRGSDSHHLDWARVNKVKGSNLSEIPSETCNTISWASHCGINTTQNTSKLGPSTQHPRIVGLSHHNKHLPKIALWQQVFVIIIWIIWQANLPLGKNNDHKYMLYDLQGGFQNLNSFFLIVYIFLLHYIFCLV